MSTERIERACERCGLIFIELTAVSASTTYTATCPRCGTFSERLPQQEEDSPR